MVAAALIQAKAQGSDVSFHGLVATDLHDQQLENGNTRN